MILHASEPADRLATVAGLIARLYAGLWTLASGHWLTGHLVPSDTGHCQHSSFRHSSASALVGARTRSINRRSNSRGEEEFPVTLMHAVNYGPDDVSR